MARNKIQFNVNEFRRIRRSPAVMAKLAALGNETARAANADHHATAKSPVSGDSYESVVVRGETRGRAYVQTKNPRAMAHEARSSSLLRVLAASGGGGGGGGGGRSRRGSGGGRSGGGSRRWSADEIRLLRSGASNADIARQTGRSESAVRAQRGRG